MASPIDPNERVSALRRIAPQGGRSVTTVDTDVTQNARGGGGLVGAVLARTQKLIDAAATTLNGMELATDSDGGDFTGGWRRRSRRDARSDCRHRAPVAASPDNWSVPDSVAVLPASNSLYRDVRLCIQGLM
ncbi:hypothetical protein HN51_005300 [Arachis hypogaea]